MHLWESNADNGKYEAFVDRTAPYKGKLTLRRVADDTVLLEREVGLDYDAKFGPDIANVNAWMDICSDKLDEVDPL